MSDLSREDMISILEGIARDGSPGLQIQAIRLLFSIDGGEDPDGDELERLLRTK